MGRESSKIACLVNLRMERESQDGAAPCDKVCKQLFSSKQASKRMMSGVLDNDLIRNMDLAFITRVERSVRVSI
jgi:DNA-binding FrmR family transcriptional regulator